jgi:hypothetical protein
MEEILFEGFPPSAEDPWCRLRAFFEHRIQVIVDHPNISRILLLDPLSHLGGEKPAARVKALKRRSQKFVARCLHEAADGGTMASDVSVEAATVIVLGAILAVGHATTSATDGKDTKRLTAEVWSVIEKMRDVHGTRTQRHKEGPRR